MQTGRISDGEHAERVLAYYSRLSPAERRELRRIRERKKGERLMMIGVFEEKTAVSERHCVTDFEKYLEAQASEHCSSWSDAEIGNLERAIQHGWRWSNCVSLYPRRSRKAVRNKYYKVRAQMRKEGLIE